MQEVTIYTDGSCLGNQLKAGGWGTLLVCGPHTTEDSGGCLNTTNNQMELLAIIKGLQILTEPCKVLVYSDSQYAVKGINLWVRNWAANNWLKKDKQPAKNKELWQELLELMNTHTIQAEWVRGHNGHPENEHVDHLAQTAARAITVRNNGSVRNRNSKGRSHR